MIRPIQMEHWRERTERPDGRILFALATDEDERVDAYRLAQELNDVLAVVVIPEQPLRVRELVREAAAVKELLASKAIRGDRVATEELELRRAIATAAIRRELAALLSPGHAVWLRPGGREFQPMSERDVQRGLSDICDEVFDQSPRVQNELVNRRQLSSAVVVAVKKIFAGLLGSATSVTFAGNRPEVSIFQTLFVDSGWYQDGKGLSRPAESGLWRNLWDEIEGFVDSTAPTSRTLGELWDVLARPPFGLRAGVIPVITLSVLIANRDRVCLFENGTYLRHWSVQHYDRIVRSPENFTVRAVTAKGPISRLIVELSRSIPDIDAVEDSADSAPLNQFLTRLFSWYMALPDYSRKTRSTSKAAQQFHAALASISDPIGLVTTAIPDALGLRRVTSKAVAMLVEQIVESFGGVVREISSSYPNLLAEAVRLQADALGTELDAGAIARRFVELRAELSGYRLSDRAAVLLLRGSDLALDSDRWCESVMAAVVGQAPQHWSQTDADLMRQRFPELMGEINDAVEARRRLQISEGQATSGLRRLLLQDRDGSVVDVVIGDEEIQSLRRESPELFRRLSSVVRSLPEHKRAVMFAAFFQAEDDKEDIR